MDILGSNLYDSKDEVTSNRQSQDFSSSNDTNVSCEFNSDEICILLEEKRKIQNELVLLREKIESLEKRKTEIDIQIKAISESRILQETNIEGDDIIDKEKSVEGVIPKPLSIKGFDNIYWVISNHVEALVNSTMYAYPYKKYGDKLITISNAFSYLGKEVLLIRIDKPDEKKMKEWKSIIDTCDKISNIHFNGDNEGYKKYLDFFLQKYPWPTYSEETFSGPDFYLKNESVYEDAYLLMNYILRFKEQIRGIYNTHKKEYWNYTDLHVLFNNCEIDYSFVAYMEMIYMLRQKGFTLAIVPILDENLLYRPKRVAQTGDIYSLYYFDDYVEDPFMVIDNNNISQGPSSYYSFSGGSTYVSGHYRSGHWRNGRYVSGGYVRGHFRR